MPLTTGAVLQNRYRIITLIGQGGFGAVYQAWDNATQQNVAVKENLEMSATAQRQFQREATMMATLRHPNLPRVIDYFILPDQGQYLVMDYIEGKSLGQILVERGGPLSEAEMRPWIQQICQALHYLHTRQPSIIHRDVKPDNIIITPTNQAMLVDFGISKHLDRQQATTIGARAITPGYSPPEQYGYGKTDARTDIYALGAVLYALLTGVEPVESVQRIAGAKLLPPHRVNPDVSLATSEAIIRAMLLNPTDRLQTAAALYNKLSTTKRDVPQPSSGWFESFWDQLSTSLAAQPMGVKIGISTFILVAFCYTGLIATANFSSFSSVTPLPTRLIAAELSPVAQLPPTYTPQPVPSPTHTQTPRPRPTLTPRPTLANTPSTLPTIEIPARFQDSGTVLVDGWEIRVDRVLLADSLTGISGSVERAAGRFALVFMSVTNRGLSTDTFVAYGILEVVDADDRRSNENFVASGYAMNQYQTDIGARINPDVTAHIVAVFDISRQSEYYYLVPGILARQSEGSILLDVP
jgi:eukaryotic-like serine/threonine-protein kinase